MTSTTATAPLPGQRVGYRRVSTLDQNTARQLDGIPLDVVFEDKASGKDLQRPELQRCLTHLRAGDRLLVHSMDRLARNLDDLRRIVAELTARGVVVEFVKEVQIFSGESNPMSQLMLSLLGAFAEFERALIKERQKEGITLAKAAGKFKGGKPKLSPEQIAALIERDIANEGHNRKALAQEFGISRETLYQRLQEAGRVAAKSPSSEA